MQRIIRTPFAILASALMLLTALALTAPTAEAANGGLNSTPSKANAKKKGKSGSGSKTVPGSKARLKKGRAIPPANAPARVVRVIRAANKIRNKPYRYGGGHASFNDSGYDCSGAVSFALRGGKLLRAPMASGGLANWKKPGEGKWITVYGASSHAYMVVAGLRFDTSMTRGNGPGWSKSMRSTPESYSARHKPGL